LIIVDYQYTCTPRLRGDGEVSSKVKFLTLFLNGQFF
jgi:hypothetical protein